MPASGNNIQPGARISATAGALVSTAGAFIRGTNAYTTTVDAMTVPNPGQTVVASVKDPYWIVPGQMVYVAGAGPGGAAAAFLVTDINGFAVTLLSPDRPSFSLPIDYSTAEQETGLTWIDGRMVYQKSYETMTTASGVAGDQPFITLPLAIADFDLAVELSVIIRSGTRWQIKLPYTDETGFAQLNLGDDPPGSGTMMLWIWQDKWDKSNPLDTSPAVFAENLPCFVTLQYVKQP